VRLFEADTIAIAAGSPTQRRFHDSPLNGIARAATRSQLRQVAIPLRDRSELGALAASGFRSGVALLAKPARVMGLGMAATQKMQTLTRPAFWDRFSAEDDSRIRGLSLKIRHWIRVCKSATRSRSGPRTRLHRVVVGSRRGRRHRNRSPTDQTKSRRRAERSMD